MLIGARASYISSLVADFMLIGAFNVCFRSAFLEGDPSIVFDGVSAASYSVELLREVVMFFKAGFSVDVILTVCVFGTI